jgi:ATP-dependent DNA ligase
MKFQPPQRGRRPGTFSQQVWLIEIKCDGFRVLPHIEYGGASSSRNGNELKPFRTLCESLATELTRSVSLDGEIVCLGDDGKCRSTISCSRPGSSIRSLKMTDV